jgi:hydrogenase expression/formation protein HypD
VKKDNLLESPEVAKKLLQEIRTLSKKLKGDIKLMEVCGTHTQAISRYGLRKLLPENVKLISGPGCPVCVTPSSYIAHSIELAKRGNIIVTFGDLMRIKVFDTSLEREKALGAKIFPVYSPLDALKIAKENRDKNVIFLAIGFETTIPSICVTVEKAKKEKLKNFKILSAHKIIPPPLKILAEDDNLKIDGFICAGHVSVITGSAVYNFLPEKFGKGAVISGFSINDILSSIKELIKMKIENNPRSINNYKRVVKDEGNKEANNLIATFFEREDTEWRGFGIIKQSGLKLKKRWEDFDACKIKVEFEKPEEIKGCKCGEVLRGIISPKECPLMGKVCTPENPVGACMVSSEGSCSAYYKYERQLDG